MINIDKKDIKIINKYDGKIIHQPSANRGKDDGLYLVQNGYRYWITNKLWMDQNGYTLEDIHLISSNDFYSIPENENFLTGVTLNSTKFLPKFKEHQLAHELLDELEGLEIGGSAHNPFGLNTRNVDYTNDLNTVYKLAEIERVGEVMPVDIVALGDAIPLPDKSVDFVINSHVIEHFFDPIKAIKEWMRLSRKYVFIIAPQRDALPSDRGKPLTSLHEFLDRHNGKIPSPVIDEHVHYSIWTLETFSEMCLQFIDEYGFYISHVESIDTKVGNGFTVVLSSKTKDEWS